MIGIHCRGLTYSYERNSSSPFVDSSTSAANTYSNGCIAESHTCQLRDISLTIPTGSVTLLVGASGSGKSTLLRTFNGLIPHFYEGKLSGTIEVSGHTIKARPLHDAGRSSAMIFQNPRTQFFTSYVDTEMAFSLENYGVTPAHIHTRVTEAATQAGVSHLLNRKLNTLSGGELQRVACACALVTDVDLLLFDEPTSNLSPQAVNEFAKLVNKLKQLGKTLIIAEHRLHPFQPSVDHVYLLSAGQIVEDFDGTTFYRLGDAERRSYGLRCLTPTPICIEDKQRHTPISTVEKQESPSSPTSPPTPKADVDGLVIKNLTFAYRGRQRLLDLPELSFPRGEVTAITGENGVGKTTLARLICGLEKLPSSATVMLNGTVLHAKERKRRCGIVMQDVRRQLFSSSTADEVRLGLSMSDDEVHHFLSRLDLADVANRHPLSLSGGQAQRLVVAALAAAGDDVVIFDEPTSGVDYEHLCLIADLLRELAQQGRIVIVITHDTELINVCADHVITLTPPITEN